MTDLYVCRHCGSPDIDPEERVPRFVAIAIHGLDAPGDANDAGAAPALRVIPGRPSGDRSRPPAVRRVCWYRRATGRVPARALVRHPACPRCGERLGYRETAGGALFLHLNDPRFRLRVVNETR